MSEHEALQRAVDELYRLQATAGMEDWTAIEDLLDEIRTSTGVIPLED